MVVLVNENNKLMILEICFSQINVGKYYVRIITAFNKPFSIEELKKGIYIFILRRKYRVLLSSNLQEIGN